MIMVPAKAWWKSRVIWFNALAIAALVLTHLQASPDLPPAVAGWLGVAVGAVNIVMRSFTTQPVAASSDTVKEVKR